MAKNIEPKLNLISEYLKLKKSENFVIPEYQRGYSWGTGECEKLWEDIESFIGSNATDPYFFGTIIIDCSEENKFNLIDGQQRTTTFLLLLKALLIKINETLPNVSDDEESESLKAGLKANRNKIMSILYKAEDEDIPSMLKDSAKTQNILIIENKSINEIYLNEVQTIIESVSFLETEMNVSKIPYKQKDNKYTNHFRNFKFFYNRLNEKSDSKLNQFAKVFLEKCQVIEIRSWKIEQAITMFNSLNSRGLPLSDSDIISAQLYSFAGENKKLFNAEWENLKKLCNELSYQKIIDIDSVLQQYMYINRALDKDYILYREDGTESADVTVPGLRRYYVDIKKELLKDPLNTSTDLIKIAENWDRVKDYPVVKLLFKFNENAKLYLASYLYRFEEKDISEETIIKFCENLIKLFTLVEISDAAYSSAKFKTFLFKENVNFVDSRVSLEVINTNFITHISSNWKREDVVNDISEYNNNILVYLNDYLYAKSNNMPFDFKESVNVEHIMPASGRNIPTIRKDAGIDDEEVFKNMVDKIGNKILLEADINKSIGREWFVTKKQTSINKKSGYKDSKFALASSLVNYPSDNWAKEDIEKATQKAANRIADFIFSI